MQHLIKAASLRGTPPSVLLFIQASLQSSYITIKIKTCSGLCLALEDDLHSSADDNHLQFALPACLLLLLLLLLLLFSLCLSSFWQPVESICASFVNLNTISCRDSDGGATQAPFTGALKSSYAARRVNHLSAILLSFSSSATT